MDDFQQDAFDPHAAVGTLPAHAADAPLDFAQVAGRCSTPIAVTDAQGVIEWTNAAFELACGEPPDTLRGRPLGQLQRLPRRAGTTDVFWQALALRGRWSGEVRLQHRDGSCLRTSAEIRSLGQAGTPGEAKRFVCTYADGEPAVRAAVARRDTLTGVLDRLSLVAAADALRARGLPLTVLTVDVAGFSVLNQQLGCAECDRLLQWIAHRCCRITESALSPALVGRTGADEFALVFEERGEAGRAITDARIRALQCGLEAPFATARGPLPVDFSFGRCEMPAEAEDAQAALVQATAARLQGPVAGDNVSHYAAYRDESRLLIDLRRAVSAQAIEVTWQPQVDLASGRLVGAEALARWTTPDGTQVPPDRFIRLAERDGLVTKIDDQLLELALRQLAEWRRAGSALERISVNMSAAQFRRPGLAIRVAEALARHGVPAACLDIELTESVLLYPVPEVLETLRALHALGVTLSIDDFGTGYSSLAYLRELPIDRIKIDRSFVSDLSEHATSREIVRSVLDLAERIGLRTIAEGIETEAQVQLLDGMGCTEGQGFLFARPMPAAELDGWCRARALRDASNVCSREGA